MLQEIEKRDPPSVIERIKKLDAERAQLIDDARARALAKANEAVDELNALGFPYVLSETGRKSRPTKRDRAPKYRNPDDHTQIWSGRGKMAAWMVELIEKGADRESFLNPDRK